MATIPKHTYPPNAHKAVEVLQDEAGVLTGFKQIAPFSEEQKHRNELFDNPPAYMVDELVKWRTEHCKDSCLPDSPLQCTNIETCLEFKPRIGILSQPGGDQRKNIFKHKGFIHEANFNFIRWADSIPVAIPYDISSDDLDLLLPQLNGVWLTGGRIPMIDPDDGSEHPYLKAVKAILNYSIYKKDELGQNWPIIGVCQGFHILTRIKTSKDVSRIDSMYIKGQNRPLAWAKQPESSKIFGSFPKSLTKALATEGAVLQHHEYGISVDTWEKNAGLNEFFDMVQTDVFEGTNFVVGYEAKNYPIYGYMYHPEHRFTEWVGGGMWPIYENRRIAEELVYRFSMQLNRDGRSNNNRLHPEHAHIVNDIDPAKTKPELFVIDIDFPDPSMILYTFGFDL